MMSRCSNRFFVVLALLCIVVALAHAIYDPREATTKPPIRREPVLPWYSPDKVDSGDDLSRSPKWQTDGADAASKKPYIVDSGTKTWSPWRKKPGSDIEQRVEITTQSVTNFEQRNDYSLEDGEFEQQSNQWFPSTPTGTRDRQQETKGNRKHQKDSKGHSSRTDTGDEDIYEGIPPDSTKSRKEEILLSTKPKSTVARYDSKLGVLCPEFDATGQFVYPPDCKFFVNCWNGRAFVQPCAPGTLFNPDTLECDFPHKVKCYGGEVADFPTNEQLDSSGNREPLLSANQRGYPDNERIQEPRCPAHVTGLLAHPSDCTKFLQCAHGGTYVMNCGPGTVFNPAISVCDWPNNVKGCEDALKSNDENATPPVPPEYEDYENKKLPYHEHKPEKQRTVSCPPDYTGLLPHPDTCLKFLQCAHGGTFIMDCGPGTAFNPSLSVCDWPYNVPGCSEEKPRLQPVASTTSRPWMHYGSTDARTWQHNRQQNHVPRDHRRPGYSSTYPNRPSTTSRPPTDWDSLRPTWRPTWKPDTWTTTVPPYTQAHHHAGHTGTGRYPGNFNEQHRQGEHGQWDQSTNIYPQSSWPDNHGSSDQSTTYHGYNHHRHHSHYHPGEQTFDVDQNSETQQTSPPYSESFPQKPDSSRNFPQEGNWNSNVGHHHGHHHRQHPHRGEQDPTGMYPVPESPWESEELDQQTQQREHGFDYSSNRRIGEEFTPNRREYGRTGPGLSKPGLDRVPGPTGNVYIDRNHRLPVDGDTKLNTENKTARTPSVSTSNRFIPDAWNQYGPGQDATQNPQWDQGTINEDRKLREWESRTNVYQSTADKDADGKLDQWASKTNIFLQSKGQQRPGVKTSSSNPSVPPYPNNVFFNANGSRGHFITKEIEVNLGHSNTKTYRPNNLPEHDKSNKTDENTNTDTQTTNIDQIPSLVLQPPLLDVSHIVIEPNNSSQNENVPPQGRGYRNPKAHLLHNSSATNMEDLAGSGSNYHHVPVPSPNLQPPYPSLNRSPVSPFIITFSSDINYYSPDPSTNLQPPHYEPPSKNGTVTIGWQYPSVPSRELQPPYFTPPNDNRRTKPATNFQPFNQLTPPSFSLNITDQYSNVPSSNIEPPYKEAGDIADDSNQSSGSTTEKISMEHVTARPKKKISKKVEGKPSASVEKENSSTTEYPDIIEPDMDSDVDILDDKQVWKPVLVFENKTQTSTEPSVIMKINKKNVDVDLFNVESAPFEEEEPPFPAYYIPPVAPINHSKRTSLPTPISGQVIRLRGGSGPHDGYVEVQGMNPGWGTVCDSRNSWTLKEAHVVCKQLGYTRGAEMAWQGRNSRNNVPTWIAANSVSCQGDEARFQSCKFTHEQVCRVERDAIGVRCALNRVAHCRKDEIPYEGQCYHLADPESGLNHAEAMDYCSQRGARLIDITNQAENDFVSEWMLQMHPEVASIITSGVGFTTMNRTLWLWEDSSRAKFKFTKWWPGWMEDKKLAPFVGSRPLCIVLKRKFPCHERPDSICVADYFFWDTEDCASSRKGHSYICKRPYDDVGCVYGKGSQYAGTANVTASGKDCLSWGDKRIAHPLAINVVNRELREKLKLHNYCRNPNPSRESRPWCFTGPGGQREYCDIPPCGNIGFPKSLVAGQCKPKHFECLPGECIPSPWVCDGDEDCTNGADEKGCVSHMDLFRKYSKHRLEGYDVQKWLNTPLKTCALRCKEADFTCRSFTHKAEGNICLLSDNNIGMTGSLKPNKEYDYYEMKERSINCDGMFECNNQKCINQTQVCNGKNDCNDRSDESICTVENLDYDIRLADADNEHEGRVEVKILGIWGQVCDDGFGMIDADVICKELGFGLGALEVRPGGFYGNMDPPTRFMVDQLKCRGNESSLRECDFEGWGVHNCQPEEAVGVVCKTAVDICQEGHWKCDKSPMCIPTAFICDEVVDCPDGSDESSEHCDAPFEIRLVNGSSPLEGRVEVRHHGIWGTVCDDDFSNATANVICRSLGYGGVAIAKKDGFFGPGEGPIWLDEVFCYGNETQLYRCEHNHWGQHNCNHDEDAGVICSQGDVNDSKLYWENAPNLQETDINDILPANCGRRVKHFNENEELIFEKVVRGTVAPQGSYPWQASIRVRGHSKSNHWCGAVILSSLHVLTAAHCLQGYNKGTYFVRAGDYNTEIDEGTEADANIEDYYIHEDFRKGHRMNNDIALVVLKGRGIPLGKDIVPVCLPPENTEYPAGLNCTISGFGSIETGKSTHSKDLRYGWIPLLDQSVCRAEHVYGQGAISDGMICAGYLDEGIDTCDGDSGGPLACLHNGAFTLYGITSWGQHCGRANKPGVYVRVSHYRPWIERKIKESLAGR